MTSTARRSLTSNEQLHHSVRAAALSLRSQHPESAADRLEICKAALSTGELPGLEGSIFRELDRSERYYWISALYMLLMPPMRRRRLAAFFTPPHLCQHVMSRLAAHGASFKTDRILDPASGGAAFLVPWAQKFLEACRASGMEASEIVARARSQLAGIEIEHGLAALSEHLIADVLARELGEVPSDRLKIITRGNALRVGRESDLYDAVAANPPYGRVFRPSQKLKSRWSELITDGYVNTYTIFVGLALDRLKPGGIAALVIPTSFIAGPYFTNFRAHIIKSSEILEVNLVPKRSDVFLDVVQDTCVLVLRKTNEQVVSQPRCHVVQDDGSSLLTGVIGMPVSGGRAWVLPSTAAGLEDELFHPALKRLADYGYVAKAGYFVWNRSKDRLSDRQSPEPGEVPLIWAHNIAPGDVKLSARSDRAKISFVTVPGDSTALVTAEAVVLQRTTNKSQRRLLIAARVPASLIEEYGAFVSENHTIVISPSKDSQPAISAQALAHLLNSRPLDERYRRISGTVNISVRLLRELPLPDPKRIADLVGSGRMSDAEIERAYQATMEAGSRAQPSELEGSREADSSRV